MQAKISKFPKQDLVTPSVNTPIEKGLSIRWEQAKQVEIQTGEETEKIWTTDQNVGDILAAAGIDLSERDKVTPNLDEDLGKDLRINIQKAFQLTLIDGGKEKQVWSTSTTVAGFLKRAEIRLANMTGLNRNGMDGQWSGSKVQVVRVEKVTDVVEEPVKFAVETKSDSRSVERTEKVVQEGQEGRCQLEHAKFKKTAKK